MPLTTPELIQARGNLRQAELLVSRVRKLFAAAGNPAMAARLHNIAVRIENEIRAAGRLIP